jgi:hypothetical protein
MTRRIKQSGLAWVDVVIAVSLVACLFAFLLPAFDHERRLRNRTACADNLQAIGKAISAYANDYDGMLPVAGGNNPRWAASLPDWCAANCHEAFGLDPNGYRGQATVSSSLYLLVRHTELAPKMFVCPVDRGTRGFRPDRYGLPRNGSASLWDFGPTPAAHCSYAYQMVYNPHALNKLASIEPGFAIGADRNPWIDPPRGKAGEFGKFKPDLYRDGVTAEQARFGNAMAHGREGQNVLFSDAHVDYEQRAFCGLDDDNIYTISGSPTKGDPLGTPPKIGVQPANPRDSVLVNDPVLPSK